MCFSFCMLLFLTLMHCLFLEVLKSSKGAEGLLEPNSAGQSKQGRTAGPGQVPHGPEAMGRA